MSWMKWSILLWPLAPCDMFENVKSAASRDRCWSRKSPTANPPSIILRTGFRLKQSWLENPWVWQVGLESARHEDKKRLQWSPARTRQRICPGPSCSLDQKGRRQPLRSYYYAHQTEASKGFPAEAKVREDRKWLNQLFCSVFFAVGGAKNCRKFACSMCFSYVLDLWTPMKPIKTELAFASKRSLRSKKMLQEDPLTRADGCGPKALGAIAFFFWDFTPHIGP